MNKRFGHSVLFSSAVIAALIGTQSVVFAEDPIKVGVIDPLTGSVAYNGLAEVNGSKLAVEERNKKGILGGRKVELVVEDGLCQPAKSVNAAEKLIQRDHVVAISGAFCSSSTLAVMPVAQNYRVPLVTGVSSFADLTEKNNPYFFRAIQTDALLAKAFARVLVKELGLKKVAYIGVNDDYGRGSVKEFEQQISALGGTTVMKEYFEHGTSDFYTLLTKLRASGADGVFVAAETQDGSIFVKQRAEFGLGVRVFGVGSWATNDFIDLAGPASEGIYAAVPYVSSMDTPKNKEFVAEYQKRFGGLPAKYEVAGYNAMNIILDAIERAGSTDSQKVRDALAATDYVGPNGPFKFDSKGQASGFNAVLVQIQNKTPKIVATTTVE